MLRSPVLGGVLAGRGSIRGRRVRWLMLPALALLWSRGGADRADATFWGLLRRFDQPPLDCLALHPLTWIGLPAWLSLPVALFRFWLVCGVAASLLLLLWSLLARWCRSRRLPRRWPLSVTGCCCWPMDLGPEQNCYWRGLRLFWIGVGGTTLASGIGHWLAWPAGSVQRRAGHASADAGVGGFGSCLRRSGETRSMASLGLARIGQCAAGACLGGSSVCSWRRRRRSQFRCTLVPGSRLIPTREKFRSRAPAGASPMQRCQRLCSQAASPDQVEAAVVAPEGTLPSRWQMPMMWGGCPCRLISGGFPLGSRVSCAVQCGAGKSPIKCPLSCSLVLTNTVWCRSVSGLPPLPGRLHSAGLSAVGGLQPGPMLLEN